MHHQAFCPKLLQNVRLSPEERLMRMKTESSTHCFKFKIPQCIMNANHHEIFLGSASKRHCQDYMQRKHVYLEVCLLFNAAAHVIFSSGIVHCVKRKGFEMSVCMFNVILSYKIFTKRLQKLNIASFVQLLYCKRNIFTIYTTMLSLY